MIKPFGVFICIMALALMRSGAMAATCDAGYWLDSSYGCTKCGVKHSGGNVTQPVYDVYCPGDDTQHRCEDEKPNSGRTSGTASTIADCQCIEGYEIGNDGQCHACGAGKYKDVEGNSLCMDVPAGKYGCVFDFRQGYYYASSGAARACECYTGYYCAGGSAQPAECPTGQTTSSDGAKSPSDCKCIDGYEMVDGVCVEPKKQTPCSAGVSVLHAGDYAYPLYNECDTPAIWIGMPAGKCCVNLVRGGGNGALNIDYNGTVYHATE